MPTYTTNELNAIKDLVCAHQTIASKLSNYANHCQDTSIKQMFKSAANEADQTAQTLIQLL